MIYRPILVVALAVSGGLVSLSVAAQSPSRSDVKAETQAAQSAGELAPAGPQPLPVGVAKRPGGNDAKTVPSDKSRAAVKAKTKAAQAAGELAPAGVRPVRAAGHAGDDNAKTMPSHTSRAEVKSETKAARRSGDLVPAGEAPRPISVDQPK